MKTFMKKHETLIYSAVGLAALFLVLVAANYLISLQPLKLDLTEGRVQTLSEGTKKILRGLDAPVKLKLYVSRGEGVPVQLRSFAQRVDDLIAEFKSVAGGKLIVEKFDPRPDGEYEDQAQLDGIEPQQLFSGEQFYLGLAVSQLDRKQAIPAVSPQRERLLEYDILRAIARVGSAERPAIGLMSALPVLGERFNPVTDLMARWASPALIDTVAAFSVVTHFDGFQRGAIDVRDLAFFLSVIGFALFATSVVLRNR